jgi:hypothetical protein
MKRRLFEDDADRRRLIEQEMGRSAWRWEGRVEVRRVTAARAAESLKHEKNGFVSPENAFSVIFLNQQKNVGGPYFCISTIIPPPPHPHFTPHTTYKSSSSHERK